MIKVLTILNTIILLTASFGTSDLYGQKARILLDGSFEDWENRTAVFQDTKGDGRFGYDFQNLAVENDEEYLYISFDTGLEINIQDQNDIAIFIDSDLDASTGYSFDEMGVELIYFFGDRGGFFYNNGQAYDIYHSDIGLITLPTVSSERFELAIRLDSKVNGKNLFTGELFRFLLYQDVQNGDKFPDESGGLLYELSQEDSEPYPAYSIKKAAGSDLRIMSYNVLFDRIFENEAPFRRQITAMNPDIIAFQEIYDHSANQVKSKIASWIQANWYAAKQGNDIIIVSKYPIIESHFVNGNGAFLIEVDNNEILVINAHLPCCDNDSGRQDEVDAIMEFIRDAKAQQSSLQLEENTPVVILGDMNFVGKNRQLKTLLSGDIQNEFLYGEDFHPDWDNSAYTDVLAYATNTALAITWYNLNSSYNPGRLDYIIYSDSVLKLHNAFNLFTASLPQDSLSHYSMLSNDTQNASDHIPVVADFSFDTDTYISNINGPGMVTIRPIPFKDHFDIYFEEPVAEPIQIDIYSSGGVINYSEKFLIQGHKHRISTSQWPNGIYFISIKVKNSNSILKAIKLK